MMESLGAVLRRRAVESPDHPVVTVGGQPVTYGVLDHRTDEVARALTAAGLAAGDHAAVMLRNSPTFLDTWMGMAKAGVVEVPLHTASRADGLVHALTLTDARMVVVEPDLLARVEEVADRLPSLRTIVVAGGEGTASGRAGGADVVALADLVAAGDGGPIPREPDPRATSAVLFTSGTTGPSKGVVLSHTANMRLARTVAEGAGLGAGDVLFTTFPLFHVAARYVSTLAAMLVGGRVVVQERFSATRFWAEAAEQGVTAIHYLGSLLTMLLAQPASDADTGHGVRVGYGAGAPEPVARAFTDRFGVPLRELYGMTETGMVTMNRGDAVRLGSCGRPLEDCEVAVVDAGDRPLPPGEVGEIVVRPRAPGIMIERYVGMPEATLAAFRNLWFHTGDLGRFDDDGYLWFVGRSKDAIRRRGENISAFEVEVVLEDHPDVAGSAVIGVPDEISGEEVLAVLEMVAGAELDAVDLLDHCQRRLPHFAVPRYLAVTDALPRNTSQRVEKHRLRAAGLPADAIDRDAIGYQVQR